MEDNQGMTTCVAPRTEGGCDVDVILLSWNRVEDTMAAVTSAVEQEDVRRNILIVDQGSTADNLGRLERFVANIPCVTLKKLGYNAGVAGGRNIATEMGCAPYIVAIDSDAVFANRRVLARVVQHMNAHPRLCALGFRINNYFTGQNDDTSWDYPIGRRPDQRFPSTRFIGTGHVIRRSVFEAVGGYDDRLFFCGEELDLCYRMLNTGARIEYFPDAAVLHKVSPGHRVFQGRGRFRFAVRNNIYTAYKFGVPLLQLAVAASAFVAKGLSNGVALEAIRAIRESIAMCRTFDRDAAINAHYRLSAETWRHIRELEPWRDDGMMTKIRRQFRPLPHQA